MTSFGLFAFCTTLKKLNILMANLLLVLIRCFMHYSGFSIVMHGETKLAVSPKRKQKSKIPKFFFSNLVTS